jgi:CRISPR-associated protein Csm4
MNLYRVRIKPLSAWRTPWQADTLAGLLCWACARTQGGDKLKQAILEPASRGEPPFVLSDAFPGDLLPVPEVVRLNDWPVDNRKQVKQARWLRAESFRRIQRGERLTFEELLLDEPLLRYAQTHNTLDRFTDTTGDAGSLFQREETLLSARSPLIGESPYLSIYVRLDDYPHDAFLALLAELSDVGFGADASAGKGQFDLVSGELEPASWLDDQGKEANGIVVLSTFQPGSHDPTEGYWQVFTKYGKLGPDFGLDNIFKRPMVMLRPGACFRAAPQRPFLGRAIPMEQLLSDEVCRELNGRGTSVRHLAYGLAVPAKFPEEED